MTLVHILATAQAVIALWLFFIALLMETGNIRSFLLFRFMPFIGGLASIFTVLYLLQVLR